MMQKPRGRERVEPEFLVVGLVLAPWGIKGEIKVEVMTDFPQRFAARNQVYIDGRPMTIERGRRHSGKVVLKLASVDTVEAAEKLRGRYLEVPSSDAFALPEGQYYRFQIIGLEAWTTEGEFWGEIADILPTGGNDVYLVRGERGEFLIPAIEDVVKSVDLEKGRIIIEAIEGLLQSSKR